MKQILMCLAQGNRTHQVTLVEKQDDVFVSQVLADVLLKEEASRAVGVTGIQDLKGKSRQREQSTTETQSSGTVLGLIRRVLQASVGMHATTQQQDPVLVCAPTGL